jgi:hypothetical protein
MANLNLSQFTEKTLVADADWVFVWDTAGTISKKVSRNSLLNSGTLATSAPVTISQTWDALAVAFTAFKVNATSTNSASGSLLLDLQVGGVSSFRVQKDGHLYISNSPSRFDIFVNNTNALSIFSSQVRCLMPLTFSNDGAFNDTFLLRDGAPNTLALRNSTAAQTFRVYNTFPGNGNNEFGSLNWVDQPNEFQITTGIAGSGTGRALCLRGAGGINIRIGGAPGTLVWQFGTSTGHLLAATDNSVDIGASGANRPRNIYVAGAVIAGGLQVISGGGIQNSIGTGANIYFISGASRLAFDLGGGVFWNDSSNNPLAAATVGVMRNATGILEVNSGTLGAFRDVRCRSVIQQPPASITPASNGDYVVEATNNTTLTFRLRGSDGTVRSATLTLAP